MRAVSESLRDAYAVNLTNRQTALREAQLIAGYRDADAARKLLVPLATYRRWRCDRRPNPTAVRLLAIQAGYVPWAGWHGWEVRSAVPAGRPPRPGAGRGRGAAVPAGAHARSAAQERGRGARGSHTAAWDASLAADRRGLAVTTALRPLAPVVRSVAADLAHRAARGSQRQRRLPRAALAPEQVPVLSNTGTYSHMWDREGVRHG